MKDGGGQRTRLGLRLVFRFTLNLRAAPPQGASRADIFPEVLLFLGRWFWRRRLTSSP